MPGAFGRVRREARSLEGKKGGGGASETLKLSDVT